MKVAVDTSNRILSLLCDTKGCTDTDVYLCPGGTVACQKHLPKGKTNGKA